MLKTTKKILKNLPQVPGALYSMLLGPVDTIDLVDDEYKKLGITVQRLRKRDLIVIKGMRFLNISMTPRRAMLWSGGFMERAAELRGFPDEKSPVDQHTFMMKIPGVHKRLSVRNAIRLGFAIDQIINQGPTYFTQTSTGGTFNITDCADYAVPDVRIPEAEEAA